MHKTPRLCAHASSCTHACPWSPLSLPLPFSPLPSPHTAPFHQLPRPPISPPRAGPGSGKTAAVVAKIVYLIVTKGVDPKRILFITFTKAAANEIKARLKDKLGGLADGVHAGTFHSLCLEILE